MKSREELFLERINAKERSAYHELFREFYRSLVMYAMRYVEEQGEAEDIVQDVFVAVWEKQDKFLSYVSFRVFLYNSVRNTCLNQLKHRKVVEKYMNYHMTQDAESEEADRMEEELYGELFRAIDELAPRCREVFLLYMDGKKNEEIAEALHIALHTVKTQKKKAMHYLRGRLSGMGVMFFYFLFVAP